MSVLDKKLFLSDLADRLNNFWKEIVKLSEEVNERRVSVADLRTTLREEYGVIV